MIKFAICDDEPAMVRQLAGYLARYLEEHEVTAYSVSSFSSGRALVEAADGFDVIFLDKWKNRTGWRLPGYCAGRGTTAC